MLNIIIISLQSVNEWPVFNLKKHIDKHSKITASKDSLQYLIRLLSSKHLLCSLNIWNFYYVIFIPVINTPDSLFPRPIVNLVGGLFWILSDSNVSLEEQIWHIECIYLAFISNLEKKRKNRMKCLF